MTGNTAKIGFVGIGAMGTPMATNLAKAGYKLVVYDTDAKRTQALASTLEIEIADSLAVLAEIRSGAIEPVGAHEYLHAAHLIAGPPTGIVSAGRLLQTNHHICRNPGKGLPFDHGPESTCRLYRH